MRRCSSSLLLLALLPFAGAAQTLDQARALHQKGALREAEKAYEGLLPQLREKDPPGLASALNALSLIATAQGDYPKALERARESAQAYRNLGDAAGETRALNNAGAAELYRGDYPAALLDFRGGLAIARRTGDGEVEVDQLNNIGSVYYLQASYLDALRAYREALGVVERDAQKPWSARKRSLTVANLAALYQRLGQEEQALQLYQELSGASHSLAPSEQARLLTNLGVLYRRLEDPVKALETYRSASKLLEREEHHDAQIGVLKNIGIVQALDLGDLRAASQAFTSALELAQKTGNRREAMQAHLYLGEALSRSGDPAGARKELEAALSMAKELNATEEQWKALYGLGRADRAEGHEELAAGRFREAIAVIESVRGKLQLPSLKTDFLADKRDVYDALIELALPGGNVAGLFELLERSRARAFQDRLAQGPPALSAVQARLDPAALMVEFWVGPRSAAALVVTARDAGVVSLPLPGAELGELVQQLSQGAGEEWKRLSALLGDRLLGPIAPALSGKEIRHLLVVPDGPLAQLPFEVLAPGGGPLLLERLDVTFLPSASLLLRDPPPAPRLGAFPWQRQLVAFADPRVSPAQGQTAADLLGGPELQGSLPASADEARAIARSCRGRAQLYLGSEDLKAHLVSAGGVPLLHLATHATADAANPERSRILFSPASENDRADYLFLKEIYGLDLRGVDLATLSACDTERGKAIRGEGVQGFSRALLSAGARAAVTTLWRVADQPAAELMKQFYFELNRGTPKAAALRAAKLRFLRSDTELRHPRYWAPFVLSGDGLRPIPRVWPWSALLGAAGAVLFAGVLALRLRRR